MGALKHLICFLLLVLMTDANAQMSGSYTVGAPTDDFPTIDTALMELQLQGMAGSVEMVISDGSYSDLIVWNIIPPTGEKLIFRSASNNADSVNFQHGAMIYCKDVEFHDLSFTMANPSTESSLVLLNMTPNARLLRCRIIDDYSSGGIWDYAPLEIDMTDFGTTNIYIDSCFISSLDGLIPFTASRQSVLVEGDAGKVFFHHDTILGGLHFNWNERREYQNCVLYIPRKLQHIGTDFMDSCKIYFYPMLNGGPGYYNLRTKELTNCTIIGNGDISVECIDVHNNYFEGDVRTWGGANSLHLNNTFNGEFFIQIGSWYPGSPLHCLFKDNIFTEDVLIYGMSKPMYFVDNWFYGTVTTLGNGDDFRFYHNNFAEGSLFNFHSWGEMKNNNFADVHFQSIGGEFEGEQIITLTNNNYSIQDSSSLYYSYFDSSPTYFNPDYNTTTDLHINNPSIFTNAHVDSLWFLDVDFDGDSRDQYRSIGADEACLGLPLPDSIVVNCGSNYALAMCDSLGAGYHWGPASILVDPSAQVPVVVVDSMVTAYLFNSLNTIVDSVVLVPSVYESQNRNLYGYCGYDYTIATYNNPNGNITWSPGEFFSDSTSYLTSVNLDTTTYLVAIQDFGQCGSRYDSILFNISYNVNAYFVVDSAECLARLFSAWTPACYDSIRWEISDGTVYDHTATIWHEFPIEGTYHIELKVWSNGVLATHDIEGYVTCVVGSEELERTSVTVFPNPTIGNLTIRIPSTLSARRYYLNDFSGKLVQEGELDAGDNKVDVSHLKKGMYQIRIGEYCESILIQEN